MKINDPVETFCVGRHLIDLPNGFRQTFPSSASFRPKGLNELVSSIDVNVISDTMTGTKFIAMVKERQSAIIATSDATTDILKEVIPKGDDAILLRVLRIEKSYTDQLHILKGNSYLTVEAKSYEDKFAEAETNLLKLANRIVLAKTPEREVFDGFCLGSLTAQGDFQEESASFEFRSVKQPDVIVKIEIDSYSRDEAHGLLERVNGAGSLLTRFDVRQNVLRYGDKAVAGQRAEEWLGSANLGPRRNMKQFGFALETVRREPGPTSPRIHIELDTGQHDQHGIQQPNSLTDEQAIALWDLMISSMRLHRQM